ncbi:MAG: VacJ family lipoprotein [Betaproteobacteria bacterium]|nr:VacJ family lipoprotein [Betaproteobacteria bacterium]
MSRLPRLARGLAAAALLALAAGCAAPGGPAAARDPLEPMNRVIWGFNDQADQLVVRPVARIYDAVTPEVLRQSFSGVLSNLVDPWIAVNQLLQGKPVLALSDLTRFLINTVFGFGGMADVAGAIGLEKHHEDLGQTLGRWGVPPGPYLVLPLLGPSSVRETAGFIGSLKGDPIWEHATREQKQVFTGGVIIETRARLLGSERLLQGASLDAYSFVRDSYLQRRRNLVHDGNPPPLREED